MSTDPEEFDQAETLDQLAYEIILLTRYGVQNTPTNKREAIMDRSALILLTRLDAQGPMTVNELAESFGLNVSTVHRQLKAAIANGLIEVVDDQACPAKLHRPTELGKENCSRSFLPASRISPAFFMIGMRKTLKRMPSYCGSTMKAWKNTSI